MSTEFQDTSTFNENPTGGDVTSKMHESDHSDLFARPFANAKRIEEDKCENATTNKINYFIKAADASFYRTELEKRMNENKIRIRYMPLMIDENTKLLVFELLRSTLDIELKFSDICDCVRVKGWEGYVDPLDIVVTFSSKDIRDAVFDNKSRIEDIEDSMTMVCDELGAERAEIWRRAVQNFGDSRVYTNFGGVVAIAWNDIHYRLHTLHQFERFMKREYSQKCNLYYLNTSNKVSDCEEMLERPEPKVEKKTSINRYSRPIRFR